MATYGLLIDYEYCTNCGSCQVSCKEEHGYPVGKTGSRSMRTAVAIGRDKLNFTTSRLPPILCDLCADRVAKGHEPTCVKHCQAQVLKYGDLEDLAKELARKPKQTLFSCEAEN